jgi:hypothetical protein
MVQQIEEMEEKMNQSAEFGHDIIEKNKDLEKAIDDYDKFYNQDMDVKDAIIEECKTQNEELEDQIKMTKQCTEASAAIQTEEKNVLTSLHEEIKGLKDQLNATREKNDPADVRKQQGLNVEETTNAAVEQLTDKLLARDAELKDIKQSRDQVEAVRLKAEISNKKLQTDLTDSNNALELLRVELDVSDKVSEEAEEKKTIDMQRIKKLEMDLELLKSNKEYVEFNLLKQNIMHIINDEPFKEEAGHDGDAQEPTNDITKAARIKEEEEVEEVEEVPKLTVAETSNDIKYTKLTKKFDEVINRIDKEISNG